MQDIYNDISSSDSEEDNATTDKSNSSVAKLKTPPKEISQEER